MGLEMKGFVGLFPIISYHHILIRLMIDKAKDFLLENKLEISCVLASSALYHIISLLKRDKTLPLPEN